MYAVINQEVERMDKKLFLSFILAGMLVLTTVPVSSIGSRTSIAMGQRQGDSYEEDLQEDITNLIISLSDDTFYENTYNWYYDETSAENILFAAEGGGESESIVFYIGHGDIMEDHIDYPDDNLYWIHTDDGSLHDEVGADDYTPFYQDGIYSNTDSYPNPRMVFLWSCWQGHEIGYYEWNYERAFGMPYAWLRTDDLSADGYQNPDYNGHAFIGFQGKAPLLSATIWDEEDANYQFLEWFYTLALNSSEYYSVNEALDEAAQQVWGVYFDECPLYEFIDEEFNGMVVYGDGSIKISPIPSGGGGGSPYPPNLPTGYLSNPSNLLIDNRR